MCVGRFVLFRLEKEITDSMSSESIDVPIAVDDDDNRQNAFDLMMATARTEDKLPKKYDADGITKDRTLFNDIVSWLESLGVGWQNQRDADGTGKAFVSILRDALWEVDGHWKSLEARGCGVPSPLREKFPEGYHAPESYKGR